MSDTDLELLARYTRQHSSRRNPMEADAEDAFAELVRRHLGLVYSAGLRQVRSPQLAEEVTQSVFIDLARSAARLKPDTILIAWLYQVTRRTAIDVVRREASRQLREQIATEMNAMNATTADWAHIEPLLDEAMHALDDTDRAAVLLRYFENKSLREVGATLGTSENAAQKRLARAVERLREFFTKRGVTVGVSGLVVVIGANAVQAAPAGLAITISTAAALAGTTIAATATATATKAIAMTATQKILVAATLMAAVGTAIYEVRQVAKLRTQVQTLQQQQLPLTDQIQQLQRDRADSTRLLAALRAENESLNLNTRELLRLRGEVGLLRAQMKSNDSRIGGRTLNEWLQDYDKAQGNLTVQAQNGIRQIGTNAIPELLSLLRSLVSGGEIGWRVTCAFRALGPMAKPAVPALIEFLQASEPEWIRLQAASCLSYIGPDAQAAIPALIAALGDKKNIGVRMNSIGALSRIGGDSSVLIPVFTASLDDSHEDVRVWAATGLRQFGNLSESVVPKLLENLSRTSESETRELNSLMEALEAIGPTTTDAAPLLLKLFSHQDQSVRNFATNALKRIAPGAAARAGAK